MAEGAIFLNSGPLLNGDRLEGLEDTPEWANDEPVQAAYERIREAFEKHSTLLAGQPSVEETRFHMINPTLHALGYTYSVYEPLDLGADRVARVDYVCFANSNDFLDAVESRGSVAFFRQALMLVRGLVWNSPFDTAEGQEGEEAQEAELAPAMEIDFLLRTTGRDYGVITNGCDWRLVHQASSGHLDTFLQADMIAAMKTEYEDFKRFYLLFAKSSFLKDDSGTSFVDRLLQ